MMYYVTYTLLGIGKEVMKLLFMNYAKSLTDCLTFKKNHKTCFHKMCNITHKLLVIGKDVMRLPFTKGATFLTRCWSQEKM